MPMSSLTALLGGLSGWGKGLSEQQQMHLEQQRFERQARADDDDRTMRRGQYERAEADRVQSQQQQALKMDTLRQHWGKAAAGDPDSQAAIVAIAPELASRFQAPAKAEPTAPRTINTKSGIYGYDETEKRWKPTQGPDGKPLMPFQAEPSLSFQSIGGTATEPGKVVGVDPRSGKVVAQVGDAKAPTAGAGSAKMMQAIASNQATLSNIDAAIKAVQANPGSFGTENLRGLPIVGDWLDQRRDPSGVGPRANVANIGSQKMHDRSGAAVTASEFPRLKPFIPGTDDPSESIITKLEEMKKVITSENEAMRQAGAATQPVSQPPAQQSSQKPTINADQVLFLRTQKGMSMADIQARYIIRP